MGYEVGEGLRCWERGLGAGLLNGAGSLLSVDNSNLAMIVQSVRSEHNVLNDKTVMMNLIERLLTQILRDTRHLQKGSSAFHCKDIPNISVGDYLKRIGRFANCSNSIFVIALIYIDRVQQASETLVLNNHCVHRLLISTVMVAAKYADDFFYKNDYYAKVGGISKNEINQLEIELLSILNYHLHVREEELNIYLDKLQAYRDVNQAPKLA